MISVSARADFGTQDAATVCPRAGQQPSSKETAAMPFAAFAERWFLERSSRGNPALNHGVR
jgi:hypothetical protein